MNRTLTTVAAVFALALAADGRALATAPTPEETKKPKPTAEEIAKAEKAVKDELAKYQGGERGKVQAVAQDAVFLALPKHVLVSVVFSQYPVARQRPEGLNDANLFAVPRDKDGKLELVKDDKELEKFFRAHASPADADAKAKDAVHAWLHLSAALVQDGFYKFAVLEDSTKVAAEKGGRKASGKLIVTEGGKGEITATLTFDEAGKLTKVDESKKVVPGVRPICQATKLLDPDELVRRMAEQDLLVMGSAAKDYLDEQRAKAPPALQKAIDRIWKRIVDEGR